MQDMDTRNTMRATLKAAFKASGWSILRLAKTADVPYCVAHKLATGDGDLQLTTASRIAGALGLELRPAQNRK